MPQREGKELTVPRQGEEKICLDPEEGLLEISARESGGCYSLEKGREDI